MTKIWLALIFSAIASAGPQGHETGNGGDGLAERFVQRGYVISSILHASNPPQTLLTPAQLDAFDKTLRETRVAVVDVKTLLDNQNVSVEARNVPDPNRSDRRIIQLKQSAWQPYLTQGDAHVFQLVFHEYLLVANIGDANYVVSHQLSIQPGNGNSMAIRTCGLTGTNDERVQDCARPVEQGGFGELAVKVMPTSTDDNDALSALDDNPYWVWRLVTRAENRQQFWRDEATHLVWSDRSAHTYQAREEAASYCSSITGGAQAFYLPAQARFETAIGHGLRGALPRMAVKYWTYDSHTSRETDTVFYGQLLDEPHPFFHYDDHPHVNTNYYDFYQSVYARCISE